MARNKLATHARKLRVPTLAAPLDGLDVLCKAPSPSDVLAGRDLLMEVLNHLTAEERRLAELRGSGLSWPEVASSTGGSAEARRKQLARALDRVMRQLHLETDY
jgi:DNA-directed RNA polymerase specialized sigma24 family protein